MSNRMPQWPLIPIALPAAVAIWSGWVGLGGLCGFGPVHVLPGINDWTVNTAICLPIGMEAYAAFALAVWLRKSPVPGDAKIFAKWSAFGALALGLLGQVAFHVLTSHGWARAPVTVTVLVSCIPVAVVGLAAALTHLMSQEEDEEPETVSVAVSAGASVRPPLPAQREIQRRQGCGQATAKKALAEVRLYARNWDAPGPVASQAPAAVPPAAAGALNGQAHGS